MAVTIKAFEAPNIPDDLKKKAIEAAGPMSRIEDRFTFGLWDQPRQTYGNLVDIEDVRRHYMNVIIRLGPWMKGWEPAFYREMLEPKLKRCDELGIAAFVEGGLLIPNDEKPWDLAASLDLARKTVLSLKDHPSVLGWYLLEEPLCTVTTISRYLQLKLALQKETPDFLPAVLISPVCSGARSTGRDEAVLPVWTPFLNLVMTDMYGYPAYTDVMCAQINMMTPRPHWVTLATFRYQPGEMPGINFVRRNVYSALAHGANGVNFYAYGGELALGGGYNMADPYGNARAPGLWDQIGELGKVLEPVGHLIAPARVSHPPLTFACTQTIPISRSDEQVDGVTSALAGGVLHDKKTGADFIVCYNYGYRESCAGDVEMLNYFLAEREVWDLYALKQVPMNKHHRDSNFHVATLEPGDGRIYCLCDAKTFETFKRRILLRRHENENDISKIDLAWNERHGLDVGEARKLLAESDKLAQAGEFGPAEIALGNAKEALKKAIAADKTLAAAVENFRQAKASLGEAENFSMMNINGILTCVTPEERDQRKLDPLDPKVRPWLDMMMKMSEGYRRLRRMEALGKTREFEAEAKFLAGACAYLRGGLHDMLVGNPIPVKYDQAALLALHDKCDKFAPERFVLLKRAYVPFDPRTVGIGDTSSAASIYTWLPEKRIAYFATEEEAKKAGVPRMK